MRKEIEEHYNKANQRRLKITELANRIKQNEAALLEKKKAYKESVAAGDDAKTDFLFHEVESLEAQIRADKHKHGTLEEVTTEYLKNDAVAIIKDSYHKMKAEHQEKADKALEAVAEAKKVYLEALKVIDGIDSAFAEDNQQYFSLINKRELTKADINTGYNQLYHAIENPRPILPDKATIGAIYGDQIVEAQKNEVERQRELRKEKRKAEIKKQQEAK